MSKKKNFHRFSKVYRILHTAPISHFHHGIHLNICIKGDYFIYFHRLYNLNSFVNFECKLCIFLNIYNHRCYLHFKLWSFPHYLIYNLVVKNCYFCMLRIFQHSYIQHILENIIYMNFLFRNIHLGIGN